MARSEEMSFFHLSAMAAIWLVTPATMAQSIQPGEQVGDVYEITLEHEESSQSEADMTHWSSRGRDVIYERIVAIRDDGVVLEYDMPPEIPAEDRARVWQFPVRVFDPPDGPVQLLNVAELETRVAAWLEASGLTREACDHWYFTWNAFKIECDPQSILEGLERFDLRPGPLAEGVPYRDPHALHSAPFSKTDTDPGAIYAAEMPIDPAVMRLSEAEANAVTTQIMGESPRLEAEREALSDTEYSGTINVTYETNSEGRVWRRTREMHLVIRKPDGESESRNFHETVERRLVSRNEP
ncbi:MAG: hypothetical protein ABR601_10415 [Parasphingopyxis sp.]|nr:hypothetical protein [Sphingomonadales bacterium]